MGHRKALSGIVRGKIKQVYPVNKMNPWQIVLSAFGGTAAALVIAGFLSKAIYEHWLRKDFKRFERKLDDISKRQEIEFQWIHTKRADVIADIYARIVKAETQLGTLQTQYKMFMVEKDEEIQQTIIDESKVLAEQAAEDFRALFDYVNERMVYFTPEFAKQLRIALHTIQRASLLNLHRWGMVVNISAAALDEEETNRRIQEAQETFSIALGILETEFRDMLRVAENKPGSGR